MNNKSVCLALFLDAPLQSWGYQSRFDRRTSLSWPTRSGVIGMISAAMGIDRSNEAPLARFKPIHMTTLVYGVAGRCTDFHTVGGGWDKSTSPQQIVKTAQGKTGNTVVTRREYLEGAKFGVVLKGLDQMLRDIHAALLNPRWGIWLGRKACIPASPVSHGLFPSEEEALAHLAKLAGGGPIRTIAEVDAFDDGTDTINDVPLSFAKREYAPRRLLT